jgi:hypothetical protein
MLKAPLAQEIVFRHPELSLASPKLEWFTQRRRERRAIEHRHAELVSASYFFKPSGIKTLKQVQGDGDGLSG